MASTTAPAVAVAAPVAATVAEVPVTAPSTSKVGSFFSILNPSSLLQNRLLFLAIVLALAALGMWFAFQYYTKMSKDLSDISQSNEELTHQLSEARQILSIVGPSFEMEDLPSPVKRPQGKRHQHRDAEMNDMNDTLMFMMKAAGNMSGAELGTAAIEEVVEESEDESSAPEPAPPKKSASEALNGLLAETTEKKKPTKKRQSEKPAPAN